MIRLFTELCKAYFEKLLSEWQIFQEATDGFSHYGESCPKCGAVGNLSDHGGYGRGLTSYEDGRIVDMPVWVLRFKCASCKATHALLPDIIVPYSPYSLLFMLAALIAYYEHDTSVEEVCSRFGIAVSTIYRWKERISDHKDLMLGVLISRKRRAHSYILWLLGSGHLSGILRQFFRKYGFSFMQNRSSKATRSRPP
jgi:transposase-like protein